MENREAVTPRRRLLPSTSLALLLELFMRLCLFFTLGVSDFMSAPFAGPDWADDSSLPINIRETGSLSTSYAVSITLSERFSFPEANPPGKNNNNKAQRLVDTLNEDE